MALHPSGLFMLVGFTDKLRLMNLLMDDIRTFKEFTVRACREVIALHHGTTPLQTSTSGTDGKYTSTL